MKPTPPRGVSDSGRVDIHSEAFLSGLMSRQLRLSIACAIAFAAPLFGLPLANYYAPDWMASPVLGFTTSWLILGVLFFPFVWVVSWIFIRRSMSLEDEEARAAGAGVSSSAATKERK